MTDKNSLRSFFKDKRAKITDKREKSIRITEKIIETDTYKSSKTLMLFFPKADEVDTLFLIKKAITDKKTVVFPITDKKTNNLIPVIFKGGFKKGAFGIYEPIGDIIDKNKIDAVIIPALSADSHNYRLGYGGGYYDRFLKDFNGFKITVLFSELLTDRLPRDEFDIKTDLVITD